MDIVLSPNEKAMLAQAKADPFLRQTVLSSTFNVPMLRARTLLGLMWGPGGFVKSRREAMAKYCTQHPTATREEVAKHFNVSVGCVVNAGVITQRKRVPSKRKVKAQNLLRATSNSYGSIGRTVHLSRERVRQIAEEMVNAGEVLPERRKTVMMAADEVTLVETYKKTQSLAQSRLAAKMTARQAIGILRREKLLDTPLATSGNKYDTITMRIVAALLDPKLTGTEIARKFGVPTPRVFNIIQGALKAGIPLPPRADGRKKK